MNTAIELRDIIGWVVTVAAPLVALYLGFREWRKDYRPSASREVAKDVGLLEAAEQAIWLYGINGLGPLHQGREKFIDLLRRGGTARVLMLSPDSDEGKRRAAFENDTSGRLVAEYEAALAICRDIAANSGQVKGIEVRATEICPDKSLVFADPDMIGGAVNVNEYPAERGTRGLVGRHRTYTREIEAATEGSDTFAELMDLFVSRWDEASEVDLTQPSSA